ncbi:hypothetical protein BJ138DRAFT_85245 [Hygrophoropsis aurantiaca]|uniref:Uncharacterized protein n=1 Tax=Hygrophoropsis aurantiaca TaxID=72124 RepID=A0ACB7ZSL2_9AGAM|nr:hypothetical protein BJ138DRAFT_85245 [Hygrophoropsis aurantiaca]
MIHTSLRDRSSIAHGDSNWRLRDEFSFTFYAVSHNSVLDVNSIVEKHRKTLFRRYCARIDRHRSTLAPLVYPRIDAAGDAKPSTYATKHYNPTVQILSFCYIAHERIVPLKSHDLSNVAQEQTGAFMVFFADGDTSVGIIIISIVLWPIMTRYPISRAHNSKFRVLSNSDNGVLVSTLNSISSSSFGLRSRPQVSRYWAARVIHR